VSQKSLNDEERGDNCLLVHERSYGPETVSGASKNFKLVLPSIFDRYLIRDDVKLAELSNNSFE